MEESRYIFLKHNNLPDAWLQSSSFVIAEAGFGTGLNFLATWLLWNNSRQNHAQLHYIAFEKAPLSKEDLKKALLKWPELEELLKKFILKYPLPLTGMHHVTWPADRLTLTLVLGDINQLIGQVCAVVDAWYLDGFAPGRNRDFWSERLFSNMTRLSRSGSTFSTFTAAGRVKLALEQAGFKVEKIHGFGNKRESLKGVFSGKGAQPRDPRPWFKLPKALTTRERAIVIGGGLAGASISQALAKRGWKITLIEKNDSIASEASGNSGGSILPYITAVPSLMSRLYLAGFRLMKDHLLYLEESLGSKLWSESGVLYLLSSVRLAQLANKLQNLNLPAELAFTATNSEASALSGVTIPASGIFYPSAGWAIPSKICQADIDLCQGSIEMKLATQALTLERTDDSWKVSDGNGDIIAQGLIVIIANAYQCAGFEQTKWLPVEAVRGQVISLPATPITKKLKTVVCYDGYILPESGGRHLIGATYDHNNFSQEIDHNQSRMLLDRLCSRIPEFQAVRTSSFIGRVAFRTSTHDRLPYIGPVPAREQFMEEYRDLSRGFPPQRYQDTPLIPGLYVSVGHGSRGLISCQLGAELLACQICGEPFPLERELVDAVNPGRYLVKVLNSRRG